MFSFHMLANHEPILFVHWNYSMIHDPNMPILLKIFNSMTCYSCSLGLWDIRGYNGEWIRFRVCKGDMIVLPPGMYHRFTVDTNNYIKVIIVISHHYSAIRTIIA